MMLFQEPTAAIELQIPEIAPCTQQWWDRVADTCETFFKRSAELHTTHPQPDTAASIFRLAELRHKVQMVEYPIEAREAYKSLIQAMSLTLRTISALMDHRHTDALMLNAYARHELFCLHSLLCDLGVQ